MPMSASPAASFGPTLFSSDTRLSARSRSVSASSEALFDADEIGVERLVAFMDLDLDVGVRELEMLRDARRVAVVGTRTADERHEFRGVGNDLVEHSVG